MDDNPPAAKKRKLHADATPTNQRRVLTSLDAPISPPPPRRQPRVQAKDAPQATNSTLVAESLAQELKEAIPSPFKLTSIQDLGPALNVDTVTLKQILGDPLIKECWDFNYLHDVEFLLDAFDPDVKDLVKIKVIHGFWKSEDRSRIVLQTQASAHSNVELLTAFLPDMWGTHHSKMLILIRHDDSAQVVIHTANMIALDWANMSQAVWLSPILPKLAGQSSNTGKKSEPRGSGSRFKYDLLNYLNAYNTRRPICNPLMRELEHYDFAEIRAALVASVPCRQNVETNASTAWGWPGLKAVLSSIPGHVQSTAIPTIIAQVSSISTLSAKQIKAIEDALGTSQRPPNSVKPILKIVFPTDDEIRRSLNGYQSGNSIHTKMGAGKHKGQAEQLDNFRPMLNHWAGDQVVHAGSAPVMDAGRKRAAPHIKTYVRFTDSSLQYIDWALVTSANLSNQAWGGACSAAGDVKIQSYEIGVVVWPKLFGENAKMVPTFKTDTPKATKNETVIGFRMPYDLPLVPYRDEETPWCATKSYDELDWKGEKWQAWP